MNNIPKELRQHAEAIRKAAAFFEQFQGTDFEDHCDALLDAAFQFAEDADEYETTET